MKVTVADRISPLAAWLILAGAVATLFPIKLEHIRLILLAVALLATVWLPSKRLRSAPFLLLYIFTTMLALSIPLPLPAAWHPLAKLLVALLGWTLVLVIPLSGLLYYLFRTAGPEEQQKH